MSGEFGGLIEFNAFNDGYGPGWVFGVRGNQKLHSGAAKQPRRSI